MCVVIILCIIIMNDSYIQLFFILSSVGFVFLWVFISIFLFYLICAMRTFHRIAQKLEKNIDELSGDAKDLVKDIKESVVFNFFFKKKKSRKK